MNGFFYQEVILGVWLTFVPETAFFERHARLTKDCSNRSLGKIRPSNSDKKGCVMLFVSRIVEVVLPIYLTRFLPSYEGKIKLIQERMKMFISLIIFFFLAKIPRIFFKYTAGSHPYSYDLRKVVS